MELSPKLWVDHPDTLHGDGDRLALQEAGVGRLHSVHLSEPDDHLGGDAGGAGGEVRLAQADRQHDLVAAGASQL